MLKSLTVKNYALIQELNIDFEPGFLTLTGETGAGKSILLGALQLALGARADSSVLSDPDTKCIVEACFDVSKYNLNPIFEELQADYDPETIIRREISPNGKSRAFINDTPVNVTDLKQLSEKLLDIHSQHQNLELNNSLYQLMVLDTIGKNTSLANNYRDKYKQFRKLETELENIKEQAKNAAADFDYNLFQLNQLNDLDLHKIDQQALENEIETLNHAEEIKTNLSAAFNALTEAEFNAISLTKLAKQSTEKISRYYTNAQQWASRLESVIIEMDDMAAEIETQANNIEHDPERATFIKDKLDKLYSLMQKHQATSVNELIEIKKQFESKISESQSFEQVIEKLQNELLQTGNELNNLANNLTLKRQAAAKPFADNVLATLYNLGMPSAVFKVEIESHGQYTPNGRDNINFLFSANKNVQPQNIAKVASGGEISRLMLSIKSLLSASMALPTIIFDEIDTGVSGEMAEKMAIIMKKLAQNMQVISITHLPQIAACGNTQYKVYKYNNQNITTTEIVKLDKNQRIEEIARLLSGQNITPQATENAKVLLNN